MFSQDRFLLVQKEMEEEAGLFLAEVNYGSSLS